MLLLVTVPAGVRVEGGGGQGLVPGTFPWLLFAY